MKDEDKDKICKYEKRVEQLEDERFSSLCKQVDEIHVMIVGNGSPGLKSQVRANTTRIKLMLVLLGIIMTALIGTAFKDHQDDKQQQAASTVIESNVNIKK